MAHAECLRYKLLSGLAVRRACYGVVRLIMENGAKGCEVVISGKLLAQRAMAMKFRDGYLISTGEPKKHYIDAAVRHVAMRQGMLGVRVTAITPHHQDLGTFLRTGTLFDALAHASGIVLPWGSSFHGVMTMAICRLLF